MDTTISSVISPWIKVSQAPFCRMLASEDTIPSVVEKAFLPKSNVNAPCLGKFLHHLRGQEMALLWWVSLLCTEKWRIGTALFASAPLQGVIAACLWVCWTLKDSQEYILDQNLQLVSRYGHVFVLCVRSLFHSSNASHFSFVNCAGSQLS